MGDIYVSKKVDGVWTKAKSIGKKINGKNTHETSACLSFDGKKLFFSSNREGGFGDLDLYSFILNDQFKPQPITYLKGKIIDADTKLALTASFELSDLEKDNLISQMHNP